MAFIVAVVIGLAVCVAVLNPLVRRVGARRAPGVSGPSRVQALLDQRETFLNALADLDGDRALGDIDAEEYHQLRGGYERQAAVVLKQLDARSLGVDGQIEAEVAEARLRIAPALTPAPLPEGEGVARRGRDESEGEGQDEGGLAGGAA